MKTKNFRFSWIFLIILLMMSSVKLQAQEVILDKNQISKSKHNSVLEDLLNGFNEGSRATIQLFHDDAIIEFPYAHSIGTPSKLNKKEYEIYLQNALSNMPNIEFADVKVYSMNKNIFWAEFHGEFTVLSTKKRYKNDYVVRVELKNGKILNLKEYWNPLAISAFSEDKDVTNIFKKE